MLPLPEFPKRAAAALLGKQGLGLSFNGRIAAVRSASEKFGAGAPLKLLWEDPRRLVDEALHLEAVTRMRGASARTQRRSAFSRSRLRSVGTVVRGSFFTASSRSTRTVSPTHRTVSNSTR